MEEQDIHYNVVLVKNDTTLSVCTTETLDKQEGNLKNFGYISVHNGSIHTKEVCWDNLEYFFKLTKKKKRSIKKELKEKEQHYKGVVKDIKTLIKRAFELELLSKK